MDAFLRSILEKTLTGQEEPSFSSLAPVDNVDTDEYIRALNYALGENKIKNIALSGPYGSGKSSILTSYQAKTDNEIVIISLATFGAEKTDPVEIEKSILQQLLYSVDASSVPYSRLKRISPVSWVNIKSALIVVWLAIAYYISSFGGDGLIDYVQENFRIGWELLLLAPIAYLFIGLVVFVSFLIRTSIGLSKIKFSLPGFDVETDREQTKSVLSDNLDEIIYFFQATGKRVIAFEDLDRFKNPKIFLKLREINKIVNDSVGGGNEIKFIYAVRDNLFREGDRTKFFDFIIPVVPVISSSNSIDKFREKLLRLDALDQIEDQLLRDVSYHLIDFRLILNIVNEYDVYRRSLPSNALDHTKLLAMMVYKNVYPDDFDALHHGRGILFEVCASRRTLEQHATSKLIERQAEIEALIKSAPEEMAASIRELTSAYVLQIALRLQKQQSNLGFWGVQVNREKIPLSRMADPSIIKKLADAGTFEIMSQSNQVGVQGVSFAEIETEVDSNQGFAGRARKIEAQTAQVRADLEQELADLGAQVVRIKHLKLSDLLQGQSEVLETIFGGYVSTSEQASGKDLRLLRSLLLNGYLDEHYSDFTSYFYEGRLGLNDLEFLRSLRAGFRAPPSLKLDNPSEVCVDMNDKDFAGEHVLNVSLMDYLLNSKGSAGERAQIAVDFIADNFEQADSFVDTYYSSGRSVGKFVNLLIERWPQFSDEIFKSGSSLRHIASIIHFCEPNVIIESLNENGEFAKFVGAHALGLEEKLSPSTEHLELYKALNVRVLSVDDLSDYERLRSFVISETLFEITSENIIAALSEDDDELPLFKTANLTSILESDDVKLIAYVDENIISYVKNVLLSMSDNSGESPRAILKILSDDRISLEDRGRFASTQSHVLSSFEGVPTELWYILLLQGSVQLNWQNIASYFSSEVFDQSSLNELFEDAKLRVDLNKSSISASELSEEVENKLSWNIMSNETISIEAYSDLVRCISNRYKNFPDEISSERRKRLLLENKIALTESSFAAVSDDIDLTKLLISNNQSRFVSEVESFDLQDDLKVAVLSEQFEPDTRLAVARSLTHSDVQINEELAEAVSKLLFDDAIDLSNVDLPLISHAVNSTSDSEDTVRMLTRVAFAKSKEELMSLISNMPEPFRDIADAGKRPKIENTEANAAFAEALHNANAISSFEVEGDSIRINTFRVGTDSQEAQ